MIALYRTLWIILGPIIDIWFLVRLYKGKEDRKRWKERLGFPSLQRPQGQLIWFHCASVGESLSILPLIKKLLANDKELNILVTTGTVTSARMMEKQLPKGAVHQFVPIDFYFSVKIFLEHWKPDLTVFLESEFWPEMLTQAPNPILVNARMSDKSAKRYQKLGKLMLPFLSKFQAAYCQTELDAQRLKSIGMQNIHVSGNLKFDAEPLSYSEDDLKKFQGATKGRKIFTCASTHNPEEQLLAALTLRMRGKQKNILQVIIPRHPHRGEDIAGELQKMGLNTKRRSLMEFPDKETDVYIADSMGEMGLFYRLSNAVFIGGSLIAHGGQNPLESLKLGKVTICGPHMHNFRKMMHILQEQGIVHHTKTSEELEDIALKVLQSDEEQELQEKNVLKHIQNLSGATKYTAEKIANHLKGK